MLYEFLIMSMAQVLFLAGARVLSLLQNVEIGC
jgi:hypothetical protein